MIPMRIFFLRRLFPLSGNAASWHIFVLIWHEFFKKHSSNPPCHTAITTSGLRRTMKTRVFFATSAGFWGFFPVSKQKLLILPQQRQVGKYPTCVPNREYCQLSHPCWIWLVKICYFFETRRSLFTVWIWKDSYATGIGRGTLLQKRTYREHFLVSGLYLVMNVAKKQRCPLTIKLSWFFLAPTTWQEQRYFKGDDSTKSHTFLATPVLHK